MWVNEVFALIPAFVTLAFICNAISVVVRKNLRAKLTAVDEIPLLALARKDGQKLAGTAVICGGSIAGLLSARICSDHFEDVIIIEPEEWVATPDGLGDRHRQLPPSQRRSRVPQYTTTHAYQVFSTLTLRKLFANFDAEVQKVGGRILPADFNFHWSGGPIRAPLHHYQEGTFPTVVFQTRPGYETTLRRLVISTCPNVKYVTGTVTGLIRDGYERNTVSSVRMRSYHGAESFLPATLVVDCTGPALGGMRWLQELTSDVQGNGQNTPLGLKSLKATYDHKMSYTTCEFDVPQRLQIPIMTLGFPQDFAIAGCEFLNIPDFNLDKREFMVYRPENNFLHITCGGWDVHQRMTSIGHIKTFLSQIVSARPTPAWIMRMLDLFDEEQVPVTFNYTRCPPSTYVQYHRAENLPSNFIAIGDSVLQLNPVRGQGCTKACVEAVTLNALLSRCVLVSGNGGQCPPETLPDDFSREFFALQARRTGVLWDIYKSEDYGWKSTTPVQGDDLQTTGAWKRAYMFRINKLMLQDREVAAVWWHVYNWLTPTTDLFSLNIIIKMAWMQLGELIGY